MSKITTIVLYVLIILSALVMGLLLFGGGGATDIAGDEFYEPAYTDLALTVAAILLVLAVVASVLFAALKVITNPGESLKSLGGILLLGAVLLIAYVFSDTNKLDFKGTYEGSDNVPSMLALADVCLYTSWILLIVIVIAVVAMEVVKKIR